ncbi:MAG: regulatory protein RecX [Gemmatimonadota bacterium]
MLPQDRILTLGLARGDTIDSGRLGELESAAERAEAIRIALRYLSFRPRSRQELVRQLRKKEVAEEPRDEALRRCEELGYLDDVAFAAAFSRDRIRLNPCGVRKMTTELRARGVSALDAASGIRDAMREERVEESELLDRAARKRARSLERLEPEVATRRLFAFLTRRGFPAAEIHGWMMLENQDGESG